MHYIDIFVHLSYNTIKKESDIMSNTNLSNISIHRQTLRVGGIPFTITTETPNAITVSAMLEAQHIAKDPNVKAYDNLNDLFKELKTE